MIVDDRFGDPNHPVYIEPSPSVAEWTLEDVDDTRAQASPAVPAPDPDESPWHDNIAATNWLAGWVIPMRTSATFRGIIEPGLAHFPQALWGNYFDFMADNPAYRFPHSGPSPDGSSWHDAFAYNTPTEVTDLHADFSSPVLYITPNMFRWLQTDHIYHYGATPSSLSRGLGRARIDACVNARHPLPLAPWFFSPLRVVTILVGPPEVTYTNTFEDSYSLLTYAWQRGVDEFLLWVETKETEPNDAWDQMWLAANRLLDWVHMLPQASQGARVARMSRLGRRQ